MRALLVRLLVATCVLLSCDGPDLVVVGTTLVSSRRVDRTTFEYVYRAEIVNQGSVAWTGVTGAVTSQAATTVVVDGALAFGTVAPGTTVTSSDTFTIRQDRNAPLGAARLAIALDGAIDDGPREGVLLPGAPEALALAVVTRRLAEPANPEDVVDGWLRTRVVLAFEAGATVGQVNDALRAVGGGIVGMRPGSPVVSVAVPRQAGGDQMAATVAALESQPGVRFALPGRDVSVALAPPAPADRPDAISHLQDARFPAAWNARSLAGNCGERVTVIVADKFHRPVDALYSEFPRQVPGLRELGSGTIPTEDLEGYHGYNVLTTLAASLDAEPLTGALPFPECLDLVGVQTFGLDHVGLNGAIEAALPANGKAILNTSYAFKSCTEDCEGDTATAPALERAIAGAFARATLSQFEDRVLVTQSTGNLRDTEAARVYPGVGRADYVSEWSIAARFDPSMSWVSDPDLWAPTRQCQPLPCLRSLAASFDEKLRLDALVRDLRIEAEGPMRNVVLVGSSDRVVNTPSSFSNEPADAYAVGQKVPTLLGVPVTGTSYAAPQVAALAAYLWLLSPELRGRPVGDTVALIRANRASNGMIDAYRAVLALDSGAELSPASSRVRLAILDVDENGRFDDLDLERFRAAFRPGGQILEPSIRDDSRFDLNGDGFTGGSRTAPFDLDPETSPRFGSPVLTRVSNEVLGDLATYDEAKVSDSDVLCHYAHGPLYTGEDLARRYELLFDLCAVGTTFVGSYELTEVASSTTSDPSQYATSERRTTRTMTLRAVLQEDGSYAPAGTYSEGFANSVTRPRFEDGSRGPCVTSQTESISGPVTYFTTSDVFGAITSLYASGKATRINGCVKPATTTVTDVVRYRQVFFDEPITGADGAVVGYAIDEVLSETEPNAGGGVNSYQTVERGRIDRIR